mmetsp:Transcript_35945/g.81577  ORF Transcript_35945/g.81577 Transcript_35945/m.81577 type:complete len:95 (-) Transcript_35945:107-391(-)
MQRASSIMASAVEVSTKLPVSAMICVHGHGQHRHVGHRADLSCRRRCPKGCTQRPSMRPSESSSSLWDLEDCLHGPAEHLCVDDAKVYHHLLRC